MFRSGELAASNNIRFIVDYDPYGNVVWFDRSKLESIVTNLVGNALKFVNPHGKIAIRVSVGSRLHTDKILILKIINSGKGITAEDLPLIFEPFYQGNVTRHTVNKGTGIGLSLTKSLVELHHGTIEVSSKPDKGTRFSVFLPVNYNAYLPEEILNVVQHPVEEDVHDNDLETVEQDIQKRQLHDTTDAPLILVVEDHEELRNFIVRGLQYQFRTEEAANGEEALAKAMAVIPDIVISDIMMPKLSGLELCNALKKDESTCHIPVILLTARTADIHHYEGLQCGADDYISKPFNLDLLSARVSNLINSRKKLQARFIREMILKSSEAVINNSDQKFVNDMHAILEKNLDDSNFCVKTLSKQIGMSRTVLYRKIWALANKPPNDFIRAFKLHRASQLLKIPR